MTIILTFEQQAWIEAHVERGEFASVEEAVHQLLDERIAVRDLDGDDLAWVKPHLGEALADIERGDVMSLEEHELRNDARLSLLRM